MKERIIAKIVMAISGIFANRIVGPIVIVILWYIALYWLWIIVSEPFKWMFL